MIPKLGNLPPPCRGPGYSEVRSDTENLIIRRRHREFSADGKLIYSKHLEIKLRITRYLKVIFPT